MKKHDRTDSNAAREEELFSGPIRPARKTSPSHILRKTLILLLSAGAAAGIFGVFLTRSLSPQGASATLSEEQIDEMVQKRLMNQTSKNLERIPVFAHRGFVEDSLENTFASFDFALLSGCPQIELDVRSSSDGVLYVCHDETLSHIADLDWKVSEHTSQELDEVVLKNGEKLHRLSEVIERYRDQLIYLIEFKEDTANPQPFIDVVKAYPQYTATMQVQSFYPATLEAIHQQLPNLFVQLLINDYTQIDEAMQADWLDSLALDEKLISATRIQAIHDAGKEVWLWTVDDPDAIRRYLAWGADGVITDLDSAVEIYQEFAANQL